MPVRDGSSVARTSPALVVTASQKTCVNEPLPLGIWLNNGSGKALTVQMFAGGPDQASYFPSLSKVMNSSPLRVTIEGFGVRRGRLRGLMPAG